VSALLWWLIPLGATLLALAWAAWRGRPARSVDMNSSMSDQKRFRAAMQKPMPRNAPTGTTSRPQPAARSRRQATTPRSRPLPTDDRTA